MKITVPMLDMINIAMSEVSVSSLVSNLAGIDSQSVKELDIFTVTAFDINSSGGGKTIDFKTLTDAEIIQAVNNALAGMKQEYLLSQDNVSVTRLPGDSACDVLNTKTMFHYWLNSKGELSFPPQAYYASKHLTIGRYNFDMGVFFAGQLEIFGQKIKVMFSSVNDKGILGYAEVSPIHNSVLIISGSRSEKNRINPVLGSTSNSTLELLTQDFYRNEVTDRPVTLYMDVSKNACNFYIDGHIELCKIFSFDALVYFANKNIRIAVETSYFNLFRASLYLNADYQKMKNLFFEFEVSLDSTGLQNNLKQLTYLLDEAVGWQQIGYMMIVYIAGLQAIPGDIQEAAMIDGATRMQRLFKITIPNMMPSITICTFLTITNSFKLFDQNLALTGGEPLHKTEMLALNIYSTFYGRVGAEGVGQAKAVVFFIIVVAIGLLQLKLTRDKEVQQ